MELKTTCLTIIRENNAEATGEVAERELTHSNLAHTDASTEKKESLVQGSTVNQPTRDTDTQPGAQDTPPMRMTNQDKTTEDPLCTNKLQLKGLILGITVGVKSKRKTKCLTVIRGLTLPTAATKLATSQCTPTCLLPAATAAAVAIL